MMEYRIGEIVGYVMVGALAASLAWFHLLMTADRRWYRRHLELIEAWEASDPVWEDDVQSAYDDGWCDGYEDGREDLTLSMGCEWLRRN